MTQQIYIVPVIGNGTHFDPFRPKYGSYLGAGYQRLYYAQQPFVMIFTDLTVSEQLTLLLQSLLAGDVMTYPEDLDSTLTIVNDVLPLFQNAHEARNITADWMSAGMTYRVACRRVITEMKVANLMRIAGESMFSIPFNNTLNTYSGSALAAFYQACDDLSLDRTGVTNTNTLREALAMVIPSQDLSTQQYGPYSV